jgi:hypothetical protein
MPTVTCPTCQARYDPGVEGELDDLPDHASLKVVCPACGQWVRLPEVEPVDPPDVPTDVLDQMAAQSTLVGGAGEPRGRRRRWDPDEGEYDRPRHRRRDEDDDDFDRPTTGRGATRSATTTTTTRAGRGPAGATGSGSPPWSSAS